MSDTYTYTKKNTGKKAKRLAAADNPTYLGKVSGSGKLKKESCCEKCDETYDTISHISWYKSGWDCQCFDLTGSPQESLQNGWRWGTCSRQEVVSRKRKKREI